MLSRRIHLVAPPTQVLTEYIEIPIGNKSTTCFHYLLTSDFGNPYCLKKLPIDEVYVVNLSTEGHSCEFKGFLVVTL